LAARAKAMHLRVDTVEAALKRGVLKVHPAEDAGYLAIASIAKDNLALGFDVIADTVNPIELTRQLWAQTAG
ncbi:MAG: adenylyl-sulfate kinase, partial [Pseudomonadota bacterium]